MGELPNGSAEQGHSHQLLLFGSPNKQQQGGWADLPNPDQPPIYSTAYLFQFGSKSHLAVPADELSGMA